jgi:hypothetical protein
LPTDGGSSAVWPRAIAKQDQEDEYHRPLSDIRHPSTDVVTMIHG